MNRQTTRLSLADEAYLLVKNKIITTAYAPGQTLNEQQICEDIGLGRTPVHQALHRLAQDGLLEIIPRKSIVVQPISLDEAAQIIEIRLINEPYASALAARFAKRADIDEAKRLLDASAEELQKPPSIETLMQIDRQFHDWITRTGQNRILGDILRQIHDRSARFWFLSLSKDNHPAEVHQEHMEILEAIASKDSERAASVTRAHVESFRDIILKLG